MKRLIIVAQFLVLATVASVVHGEYWSWYVNRIVGDPTVTVEGDLTITGSLTVPGSTIQDNVAITGGTITGTTITMSSGSVPWSLLTSKPTINGVTVTGAVLDNVLNYPAGLLRTDGSAASLTSFPTLNQSTSGTAANLSGTPALPNGTTATQQAADDATNKLATDNWVITQAYAKLAGPTFTGVPAAPTAAVDTNTTQISTTAFVIGQGYAKLASPTFTGTVTMPAWIMFGTDNVSANQNLRTTDNQVANTYTAAEFISTAADGARGFAAPNTADPTGSNLEAGLIWVTDNCTKTRSNDNTVTYSAGCLVKTFAFGIDNVVDGDDILLWKVPRALTILQVDCYASTDNVVGVLQECTAGDVTSCTDVDDTDWTITNATSGFSVNSGFENAGIAAGAWLKWVTTSEGTTNSNKLSCTVQYRE